MNEADIERVVRKVVKELSREPAAEPRPPGNKLRFKNEEYTLKRRALSKALKDSDVNPYVASKIIDSVLTLSKLSIARKHLHNITQSEASKFVRAYELISEAVMVSVREQEADKANE